MTAKPLLDFSAYSFDTIGDLSGKELLFLFLKIIGTGAVITSAVVAPNILQLYAGLGIIDDPKQRRRYAEKFRYMERKGYIQKRGHKYVLTQGGKALLTEEEVWGMRPQVLKRWDKKWHAIVFDIPSKKERGRQALRGRLKELGFIRYQNSIYISRFSARKELEAFTDFYGIRNHVRFLVIEDLQ